MKRYKLPAGEPYTLKGALIILPHDMVYGREWSRSFELETLLAPAPLPKDLPKKGALIILPANRENESPLAVPSLEWACFLISHPCEEHCEYDCSEDPCVDENHDDWTEVFVKILFYGELVWIRYDLGMTHSG